MGRAISHDALCDQWEAATVEDVEAPAIWLIFIEMQVGDLRQDTSHGFPLFLYLGDFCLPTRNLHNMGSAVILQSLIPIANPHYATRHSRITTWWVPTHLGWREMK